MSQIYTSHEGLDNRRSNGGNHIFYTSTYIRGAHQALGLLQVGDNEVFVYLGYRATSGTGRQVIFQYNRYTQSLGSGNTVSFNISVRLSIHANQIEVGQGTQEEVLGFYIVDLFVGHTVAIEVTLVDGGQHFVTTQNGVVGTGPQAQRAGRGVVPGRLATHTARIYRTYHTVAAHHVESEGERGTIPRNNGAVVTGSSSVDTRKGRESQFVRLIHGRLFGQEVIAGSKSQRQNCYR